LLIPLLRGAVLGVGEASKVCQEIELLGGSTRSPRLHVTPARPCLGGGWAKQAACSVLCSCLHVVLALQHYLVSGRLALWAQMYV